MPNHTLTPTLSYHTLPNYFTLAYPTSFPTPALHTPTNALPHTLRYPAPTHALPYIHAQPCPIIPTLYFTHTHALPLLCWTVLHILPWYVP